MSDVEQISAIQQRIMNKYASLKEEGLVEEAKEKEKIISQLANYMLAHSNIPQKMLEQELANLGLKAEQKQTCLQAVQTYGNNLEGHLTTGQGVYFWIPEAEQDAHGFKINKSLPAVILLKSIIEKLAKYIYHSLNRRKQEALAVRGFSDSLAPHDILRSQHMPYFISESVYFRDLRELAEAERKKLTNRAEKAVLLIWNGFGNEKLEWYHDQIFSLLEARIANKRPIIFTSDWNFDIFTQMDYDVAEERMKKKGGRIASRVAGMVGDLKYKLEVDKSAK